MTPLAGAVFLQSPPATQDSVPSNVEVAEGFDLSIALAKIRDIVEGAIALLPTLLIGLLVLFLFYLLAKWVRGLVRRLSESRDKRGNTAILLGKLAQWVVLVLGILIALSIILPSFDPGQLVTLLGVGGVAIGFAFKDVFQNFLAGILILITEPFQVGDQIIVGEFEGTVSEIQTRATLIKTYDGRRVVIPNSDVYTDKVTVNTAFGKRRTQYDVGIGYGDDIAKSRDLMLKAMRGVDGVLEDPAPDVLVVDLAASWVTLRARWWTDSPRSDVLEVQDKVLEALKTELASNGVDLPFETQVVLFHDQTEGTDGDRSNQREGWPAGDGDDPEQRGIGIMLGGVTKALPAGGEGSGRTPQGSRGSDSEPARGT